jgi:hypothetical protein
MPYLLHVSSLLLGAALVCAVGCSRTPAPAGEGGVGSRYSSGPLGFAVEFPFPGPPTVEDLPPQQTAVGLAQATSTYAGRGDTAFDVQVTRFPSGSLAKDIDGLLKVDRDQALRNTGFHLVKEHSRTLPGADGAAVPGLELVVDAPGHIRVFRFTVFVADRGYTLSAGGPESDPAMSEDAFERFVVSFRLL